MAESMAKRSRSEDTNGEDPDGDCRCIKLDMTKYGEWVRKLSNAELVDLFGFGVKIKESVMLTVDVGQDVLASQIEPVKENIAKINTEVNKISTSLGLKPNVKGLAAEKQVIKILQERFTNFTVSDVSKQPRSGDILVETPRQSKIMIEVKNRSGNVPTKDVDRFKEDLANSPAGVKVGILFSMKTGIANKASHGKFEVKFDTNQYQIYVPNAGEEEDLIVWSVVLADELAQAVHGELRTTQVQELQQLFNEFKESKDLEKTCRENLKALENSTDSLKKNLNSILKTVGDTRRKLENLLNNG